MTDLELLKLSAEAVGVDVEPYTWNDGTGYDHEGYRLVGTAEGEWNPLDDSEQALTILAVLHPGISYPMTGVVRRAIVEAAATRELPNGHYLLSSLRPEQIDCRMCSQCRLQYGVARCGSTIECVDADQFKPTRQVAMWLIRGEDVI